ncbi:MAG: alpha-L-fucosidase [Bacteroidota bacterium]|nr:alpha-L-fucosidase [Bacteroidota bacterium]
MKKLILGLAAFCLLSVFVQGQSAATGYPENKTSKKILDGFMDLRFGMFIHWGPVSLRGTEIGWSRNSTVAQADYDSLYKEFDPVLFNSEAWVKTAKDAGMKYLTIISKHHDGFCMWPTAYTDYNIMHSQYKKDVVGELAAACRRNGIKFCIYYSVLDWHHPDYPLHNNGIETPDPKANMGKYIVYMKNQLKELITRYHPYMLWFDGNWESPWTYAEAADMYNYIKKLDPSVIINNRLGKGSNKEMTAQTVGDYETPEQEIGAINMETPWETCMTICTQWAWKPNDQMKSLKECIRTLASTAGGNGNLLLNVSPMLDGRMEARQVKRLKEVGDWLKKNGEAIYNTKGGPFKPDSVYAATRKGSNIYLLIFRRDNDQLTLPALRGVKITDAHFLHGEAVTVMQDGQHSTLRLPEKLPDENCSVLVLKTNGNVDHIPVINK